MVPILNCSSILECQALMTFDDLSTLQFIHRYLDLPFNLLISLISLIGMFGNFLSFLSLLKCTCEFNQFLTIFTFNSLVLNTHYFISHILFVTSATVSYGFWFYSLTVYFPVATISFTYGGLLVYFNFLINN